MISLKVVGLALAKIEIFCFLEIIVPDMLSIYGMLLTSVQKICYRKSCTIEELVKKKKIAKNN